MTTHEIKQKYIKAFKNRIFALNYLDNFTGQIKTIDNYKYIAEKIQDLYGIEKMTEDEIKKDVEYLVNRYGRIDTANIIIH